MIPSPLYQHFVEWYQSLTQQQQHCVRELICDLYRQDLKKELPQGGYEPSADRYDPLPTADVNGLLSDFIHEGSLDDIVGRYIVDRIQHDDTLRSFTDILVRVNEVFQPLDGVIPDEHREIAQDWEMTLKEWQRFALISIAEKVQAAFPAESKAWATAVQTEQALRRAQANVEANKPIRRREPLQ